MPRHKRLRGGQPGNQNARKHGFYAKKLSPQESCEYLNIINTTGVAPEVAVLRLKLQSVFRNAPANYPVLRDASKLLAKQYSAQNPLSKQDKRILKRLIREIVKAIASGDQDLIKQIVAKSTEILENSNNESILDRLIDKKIKKRKEAENI
jgi:hypothetical protein